jgi:hypothetical protein
MAELAKCTTICDWDPRMVRQRAVGLLALLLALAPAVAAQSSADTATRPEDSPPRAWVSLGLGAGNSDVGGFPAVRAAASIAISRPIVLTLAETSLGGPYRNVASTNLLLGIETQDPHQFVFLSAGLAMATCGNGCRGQSGIALDGGFHMGARHAGVALAGFAVRTPEHNRCHCNSSNASTSASGVLVSIDLGWFVH